MCIALFVTSLHKNKRNWQRHGHHGHTNEYSHSLKSKKMILKKNEIEYLEISCTCKSVLHGTIDM